MLWDVFGEDRILFGSDWPNSEHVGPVADVLSVGQGYIQTKSAAAQEKVYWRNSAAAYKWTARTADQPRL
jgi:predicted TIM-barrel fold metal-dependent hydrolase